MVKNQPKYALRLVKIIIFIQLLTIERINFVLYHNLNMKLWNKCKSLRL
ncbi:unnamed protein product [Paramecium octaurelia]|uniref:Uncharacterized protein n=1 Tax=Paramecium octaurelia TaxID=43137 RepID=A0A8S1U2V9_PAROT|nr:unnamed protein product [Paramecium octaurelia]